MRHLTIVGEIPVNLLHALHDPHKAPRFRSNIGNIIGYALITDIFDDIGEMFFCMIHIRFGGSRNHCSATQ